MTDRLIKHGFILIFLALVTGFVIPQTESPRLCTIGAYYRPVKRYIIACRCRHMGQVALVRASIAHHLLGLGVFGLCQLGRHSVWRDDGVRPMTPLASDGATGAAFPEMLVGFLLISLSLAALVALFFRFGAYPAKSDIFRRF